MAVRLLFDENLPPGLVRDLSSTFPGSIHVRDLGLQAASDDVVWARAAEERLIIVTKDDDFRQRSFLRGFPPKVVWLRIGNCGRRDIAAFLRNRVSDIERFAEDASESLLVLRRVT